MGGTLTLGTFCHENGHMVCDFPDLYDYGGQSLGVGKYCLMCGGGNADPQNPVQVCAYLKHRAGWAVGAHAIAASGTFTVRATNNAMLVWKRSSTEYLLLENREASGRDAALPASGLAVWHVDEMGDNSNEQMTAESHYECSLVQADGAADLEHKTNQDDDKDLFGAFNKRFDAASVPPSRWWDGSPSGLALSEISAPGPEMTFRAVVQAP